MSIGFLDSNILVYAFSADRRAPRARMLLEAGATIGVQSLNEFTNVALRKLKMSWHELDVALNEIHLLSTLTAPVTLDLHRRGLLLAERYRLSIYDALIAAAALNAGCRTLWSEDMHNGLIIEKHLEISNPFANAPG